VKIWIQRTQPLVRRMQGVLCSEVGRHGASLRHTRTGIPRRRSEGELYRVSNYIKCFRALRPSIVFIILLAGCVASFILCVACTHKPLRGSFVPSHDGDSYLAVMDANSGHCDVIMVDGEVWPYSIGQAARIEPGRHTIECGATIQFDIPPAVVFQFDYWGP
jgi:hypothetical protein